MDIAKHWVSACRENPICKLNYSPNPIGVAFRPTRLIVVGASNDLTVRLIDDQELIVGTKSYGNYAVSGGGVMIPTGGSHTERVLIENPDYRNPEQKRLDFLRSAALEGMRGEFQLLLTAEVRTHHQRVEFHCAWYEIVDRYSIRVLTRENDRLIAIAGIATFIERSTRRRFIAGVWERPLC
jgi:hypothetical protein